MSKRRRKKRKNRKFASGKLKDYMVIEDSEGVRIALEDKHDSECIAIRRNPNVKVLCLCAAKSVKDAEEYANIVCE